MQALFSSFYANPCRDSTKPKMATNGGLKPFLGIFSCNLLLRFGEIPIFSLYNVAHFWKVCPSPFLRAFFCALLCKIVSFSRQSLEKLSIFPVSDKKSSRWKKVFPCAAPVFPQSFVPLQGGFHHGHRLLPHLPQRAPPSSSTALVERHRPCSSQ